MPTRARAAAAAGAAAEVAVLEAMAVTRHSGTIEAVAGSNKAFTLKIDDIDFLGPKETKLDLLFEGQKPPLFVRHDVYDITQAHTRFLLHADEFHD